MSEGESKMATARNDLNIPGPQPLKLSTGSPKVNLDRFKDEWNDWILATGQEKKTEAEKAAILRVFLGSEAKEIYYANELNKKTLKASEILDELEKIIVQEENVITNRFKFQTYNQEMSQKFADYLLELKKLHIKANYEGVKPDEILRDKIVQGIGNKKLQKELLKMKDPTLVKVVQTCHADEAARMNQEVMNERNEQKPSTIEEHILKQEFARCKFCGMKHEFVKGKCPAISKECNKCGRKGHFAKCCYAKERAVKENKAIYDEDEREIKVVRESASGLYKKLEVTNPENLPGRKRIVLDCYLDTGACANVIGYHNLCKLLKVQQVKLMPTEVKLRSFGGHKIQILGKYSFNLRHKEQNYKLSFNVTETKHGPLLSRDACLKLELLKIEKEVKSIESELRNYVDSHKSVIDQLLINYACVFEGLGRMKGEVKLAVNPDVNPIIQAPRRHPLAKQEKLKEELDKLLRDGIIMKEEEHTDWCSNIMLLERNGKTRLVLDPIPLNKALLRPNYQFPTVEELLPAISRAKVFSKLDARKGFWQVVLDEASSKLTTFWTPFGRYRFKRMPFGISPAPEIFQHKQNEVLNGLKGVEVMADDLLVYGVGDTMEQAVKDHNHNLEELLKRLKNRGCKLNKEKLSLLQEELIFYGHVISREGLKPDPQKVAAIKQMEKPRSKEEVHRFLGMVNYLAKFIPHLSSKTEELRQIIHKEGTFEMLWNKEVHDKKYEELKNAISEDALLRYIQLNKPIVIEADSSCYGLGACLSQEGRPLYYASRVLTSTERKYAQIEKELLAIRFACSRFDQFIAGNPDITVRTDHKPLLAIFKKPVLAASKRIQVMLLQLQRYNVKLEYHSGKEVVIADTLSRAPIESSDIEGINIYTIEKEQEEINEIQSLDLIEATKVSESRLEHIKVETSRDAALVNIMRYISSSWPDSIKKVPDEAKEYYKFRHELTEQNGLVIRGQQIVIPRNIRKLMIEKVHMGHQGIEYTINLARSSLFWPGMGRQISDKVASCDMCIKYSASNPKEPMMSHKVPEYPQQIVSMDICEWEQERYLISICHYSDFIEVNKIGNMRASTIIDVCKNNFARYGIPEVVITDGGMSFCNEEFEIFRRKWQFKHVTSSPHHQQGNGKAEAAVKVFKSILKKSVGDKVDWQLGMLNQRNTANKTGFSPNSRFHARTTRSAIPALIVTYSPKIPKFKSTIIEKQREKAKDYYDKTTRLLKPLKEGDIVWIKMNPQRKEHWKKGKVMKKLNERDYLVKVNNTVYRRNRFYIKLQKDSTDSNETVSNPEEEAESFSEFGVEENDHEQAQSEQSFYEDCEEEDEDLDPVIPHTREPSPIAEEEDESRTDQRPRRRIQLPKRFQDFIVEPN